LKGAAPVIRFSEAFPRAPLFSLMLKIYTLSQCSTCRDATKWLRAHRVEFSEHPIRETPPSPAELRQMLAAYQGQIRRLFNSSGEDYRALKMSEKLPKMTEADALALLAANGRLVKRPFLIGPGVARVGFDEKAWTETLLPS
jgi:arsenate reductase (glutaredoxin)